MNSSTESLNASSAAADQCAFEQPPLTHIRFWIVTVFGATISLISIVENSFLFYLFSSRKHHRHSYNMYMMFLAFFDIFVSGAYILLMSINVLADYLESPVLVKAWFRYMVPILTVSHIGITSSSFLILAATFERYCITVSSTWVRRVQRNRKWIAVGAIVMGVLSKGSIAFEFRITHHPECEGLFQELQLKFADFVYGTPYHIIWRFWYRNFVTVFFPFLSLLALNISIVRALTRDERLESYPTTAINHLSPGQTKRLRRKKIARSATRTTVLVVCTYLISNVINVVLTTWEHVDQASLLGDYIQFYAIAVDLASLLTNIACAFRPIIYLICQAAFRKEVASILKRAWHNGDNTVDGYGINPAMLANNSTLMTEVILTNMFEQLTILGPRRVSENVLRTHLLNSATAANNGVASSSNAQTQLLHIPHSALQVKKSDVSMDSTIFPAEKDWEDSKTTTGTPATPITASRHEKINSEEISTPTTASYALMAVHGIAAVQIINSVPVDNKVKSGTVVSLRCTSLPPERRLPSEGLIAHMIRTKTFRSKTTRSKSKSRSSSSSRSPSLLTSKAATRRQSTGVLRERIGSGGTASRASLFRRMWSLKGNEELL